MGPRGDEVEAREQPVEVHGLALQVVVALLLRRLREALLELAHRAGPRGAWLGLGLA